MPMHITAARNPVIRLHQRLRDWPQSGLANKRRQWQNRLHALAAMDPRHVLRRGYTLALRTDGSLLTSASGIAAGDDMQVHFHDGRVDTRVTGTHTSGKNPA